MPSKTVVCIAYFYFMVLYFIFTGAVALKNIYLSSNHRFVNTEVNCSGLESNIADCIQNLDIAYSCLSFEIASVSCHGKFASFPPLYSS